jgi:hypothetical protein
MLEGELYDLIEKFHSPSACRCTRRLISVQYRDGLQVWVRLFWCKAFVVNNDRLSYAQSRKRKLGYLLGKEEDEQGQYGRSQQAGQSRTAVMW